MVKLPSTLSDVKLHARERVWYFCYANILNIIVFSFVNLYQLCFRTKMREVQQAPGGNNVDFTMSWEILQEALQDDEGALEPIELVISPWCWVSFYLLWGCGKEEVILILFCQFIKNIFTAIILSMLLTWNFMPENVYGVFYSANILDIILFSFLNLYQLCFRTMQREEV